MPSLRQEKVNNLIKELAAQFIEREGNNTSLITVTDCSISKDLKKATIFITVFPENREKFALDFLKRKRGDLRGHIKKHIHAKTIPFLEVEIDKGEKNRQRIDELLNEGKKEDAE